MTSVKTATKLETREDSDIAHAYSFSAATGYHQNYVLKRLLPEAGLYVV